MDGEDLDQATRRAIAEAAERFRAESAARNQPQPPRGFTAEVNQEVAAAGQTLRQAGYDPNTAVDVDPADLSSSGLTPEIGSMSSTPRSGTDPFARPAPAGASDAPFQRGAFEPRAFGSEIPEPRPVPAPTPALALESTPGPTPALTPAPAPAQAVPDAHFERQEVEVSAETQSRHTTSETTQQEQAAPEQTLDQAPEQTPELTQAPKLNH
jgi:hypothetical protein